MQRVKGFVKECVYKKRLIISEAQKKRWDTKRSTDVVNELYETSYNPCNVVDHDHTYQSTESQSFPTCVAQEQILDIDGSELQEKATGWREGRRIVNLGVLADGLAGCKKCGCPLQLNQCWHIQTCGLAALLKVTCSNPICQHINLVPTGKRHEKKWDVNRKLATAMVHTGIGERQVNSLLAGLNIPPVSHSMLDERQKEVGKVIEAVAHSSTTDGLKEEQRISEIDNDDGAISVSVDAGWQKRGSGKSYDSLSGHCTMIGEKSGKVVGFSVRSKTCRICYEAKKRNSTPSSHDCRQNWQGSSKGMEPDMVSEMVLAANKQGVRVKRITGDEDTTTIARLRANVDAQIEKHSDKNHIRKTLGNMLHSLRNSHKILTVKIINYLQKCFNFMIAQGKDDPDSIKKGLKALPRHPFGDHQYCGQWCRHGKEPSARYKALPHGKPLTDTRLQSSLLSVYEGLEKHAGKLANMGSTQSNESFNKTVASKAPKSHHYSGSASLNYRVAAGVAQKNLGQKYVMDVNEGIGISPGSYTSKLLTLRDLQTRKRKAISTSIKAKKRRLELKASRHHSTASAETREGASYQPSINLDANADVEEIPTPKFFPDTERLELDNTSEIFFDLETTGLARTSHIIQIAALREEETFSNYIMPKTSISLKASEVTSIRVVNGAMFHKDKPVASISVSQGLDQFCNFLQKTKNNILIGHNIQSYDCYVLLNALHNCNRLDDFQASVIGFVDTLKLFKSTHPEQNSYSQPSLVRSLTGTEYSAHDALADVIALKQLLDSTGIENHHKQKASFSIKYALDAFGHSREVHQNFPSLKVLVNTKAVSLNMAKIIAGSGLSYKHLLLAYKRNARAGIEEIFQEKCGKKVRVTRSQKIIDSVADFFSKVA